MYGLRGTRQTWTISLGRALYTRRDTHAPLRPAPLTAQRLLRVSRYFPPVARASALGPFCHTPTRNSAGIAHPRGDRVLPRGPILSRTANGKKTQESLDGSSLALPPNPRRTQPRNTRTRMHAPPSLFVAIGILSHHDGIGNSDFEGKTFETAKGFQVLVARAMQ